MSEDPGFVPYILTMFSECGGTVVVRCLPDPGHLPPVFSCSPNGGKMLRRKGVDMADKSPRKVASKKSGQNAQREAQGEEGKAG